MAKTAKERILKNIREGLMEASDHPFPNMDFEQSIYPEMENNLALEFAQHFVNEHNGEFYFCENPKEFVLHMRQLMEDRKWDNISCVDEDLKILFERVQFNQYNSNKDNFAGVTLAESLIARDGSILISSHQKEAHDYLLNHDAIILVTSTNHIQAELNDGLNVIRKKYNSTPNCISIIKGSKPEEQLSRFSNIYTAKEIHLFLIDN